MTNNHYKNNICLLCGQITETSVKNLFDTRFGTGQSYTIGKCGKCSLEQTHSTLASKELKYLYEAYYNFGGERGTIYTRLRERFLSSYLYRLWLAVDGDISFHNKRGSGRLIDIGCNEGRGLVLYQRNGFAAEGLEFNETAAAVARSRGLTVHAEILHEFHPEEKFDVVVLSNVLEHSLNPREMLEDVFRILNTAGQVWISCPNNKSWLRTFFGRYWINWHVPFHIVHFSQKSLTKLLEETGFIVLESRQETPALWAAQSLTARLFAKRGTPTKQLRNPLLIMALMLVWRGVLFPLLWLGNRLGRGDCLVITARKK